VLFWFAFHWWPMMLTISSCIYWSFVLLLSINCLVHLLIYSVSCWFFVGFIFLTPCVFWLLIPWLMYSRQRFSPIL
jgi:hypothetical protein